MTRVLGGKAFGKEVGEIKNEKSVEIVELDEMHTYIQSKKTTVGSRLLLIDMKKNTSTSLLVIGGIKLGKNYGKKLIK